MSPEATNPHAELKERLRFETLIADLSSRFIGLPSAELDHEIMDALRRVCEALAIDLAAVWQWSDVPSGRFIATHFFSALEGPQSPGDLRQEDYPWLGRQLLAGRTNAFSSLDDFPPEAALDRENCRQLGIKSHLSFPLAVGGEPTFGILGLNTARVEHEWPAPLVKRLQLVAQIFANALARKRADQALRESEERLNMATEAAGLGVWGWDVASGDVWGSVRWKNLFGFAPGEQVSFEKTMERIHPEDREQVVADVRRSLEGGSQFVADFRVVLPDGALRWIMSRGRGYPDANGTPARMLGTAADITERKRIEEALRASEARLAAGTELAGLGYYEVDYAERTCFLDDRFRQVCGVPTDLRHGLDPVQFWSGHIHPEDRQLVQDERQKLHNGNVDRISLEYRYLHPALGQRWLHHSARVAERRAGGAGIRTFGVIRDITERKRVEAELMQRRTELAHVARVSTMGQLASSLAHELNQPLGAILRNAEAAELFLQDPSPDLEEVRAILADIRSDDQRAGEVIDRVRALMKRREVSRSLVDPDQLASEVFTMLRPDAELRRVQLALQADPPVPPVHGDRVQLQQVLLNLLLNAMDAVAGNPPAGRLVTLRARPRGAMVEISVSDNGHGIPADRLARLFEPFFTSKPNGLGMGLAISRSIVEAHGGRMWAHNEPAGGAVFHFELPVAEVGKGEQTSVNSGQ